MLKLLQILVIAAALPIGGQTAESLFEDPIVAKGKGLEIRQSHLDEAYTAYKAARAALGQPTPSVGENQMRGQVLEKMIATKLLLARASEEDRAEGEKTAAKFVEDSRNKAPSEASYRRQLLAVGTTPEKYEEDIREQAIVKAVIDRELRNRVVVTPAEARKFYDENPGAFEEPEKLRVAHILIATRKIPSGEPLSASEQREKRALAQKVQARAQAGEDFTKLVEQFTEDPESRQAKGELTFSKGGPVPPSFEAAAFSLKVGQVSDMVRSALGYHIIKLLERIPATRSPFDKVEKQIGDILQQRGVQSRLNSYVQELMKEAGVEITPAKS